MRRVLSRGAVRGCVAFVAALCAGLLFVLPAGAAFPSSPGSGSPSYGECNETFSVPLANVQPALSGYGIMLSCNLALPNGDTPAALYPIEYAQTAFCSGFACVLGVTDFAPTAGTASCGASTSGVVWLGHDTSGSTVALCQSGSPSTAQDCLALACVPPSAFDTAWAGWPSPVVEMMGYQYVQAGTPTGGYTGWVLEEFVTELPWGTWNGSSWTVSGSTATFDNPSSAMLSDSCGGSDVSASNLNQIGYSVDPLLTTGSDMQGVLTDVASCSQGSYSFPAFPSDVYAGSSDAGAANAPCALTSVVTKLTGSTTGDGSTAYPVTFTWSGSGSAVVIEGTGQTGSSNTLTLHGQSFSDGVVYDDTASSPDTLSVTLPSGQGTGALAAYCWSGSAWYDWGPPVNGGGYAVTPGSGGGSLSGASCDPLAGMSLYNPVSWVTGWWQVGVCTIEFLVVPSSVSVSNLTGTVTSHAPFSYAADVTGGVVHFVTGLEADVGSACSAPAISPFPAGSLSDVGSSYAAFNVTLPTPEGVCSGGTAAGNLFGFRSAIRAGLLLVMLAGVFALGWRMAPWSRSGDVRILEKWAALNSDGDYVETFVTNEGSD